MLKSIKKYFSISKLLKNKFSYPTIFVVFSCLNVSAQQIVLNNLKQMANAYICQDAATKKFGLQSLDRRTQLLPMEYDDFYETGKSYMRYLKMVKNESIGIYDCLNSQIFITTEYAAIEIIEFPLADPKGKYYKDIKNYFITSKYAEKNVRNKGLYDDTGEVLPCEYESIKLLSGTPDSVKLFTVRKRKEPLQIYDYTHRRFLPQTFSNIEPEPSRSGQTRYQVLVNGKAGIVDVNLNWIIEPNYKEILVYDQYNHSNYPGAEKFIYVLKLTDSTWTFTSYSHPKIAADQPQYSQVRNYNEYVYVYQGKKLGLVNLAHKQILPYEYEELLPFEKSPNLWAAYANKHYGIVNINNEKLCPFKYTVIQEIKPPYVLLYTDETFTIFNTKTRKKDSRVFKNCSYVEYDESLYMLSALLNNKVVLLDSNLVIKKTYDDAPLQEEQRTTMHTESSDWRDTKGPDFGEPLPPQQVGGTGDGPGRKIKPLARYNVITSGKAQGVIDNESGKEVVKPIYKRIIAKQNASGQGIMNFVGYQQDDEFGVIDLKNGKTIFSDKMNALSIKRHGPSKQNLIYFELEYKVDNSLRKAIADTSGILTKALYDQVSSFSDNGTLLTLSYYENAIRYSDLYDLDNKEYIIKKTELIKNISARTKLNHFLVIKDSLYGVINQQGSVVIPIKYKHLKFDSEDKLVKFSNKLGVVQNKKNKYAGLIIDKDARVQQTDFYDSVYHAVKDLMIVKNKNNYGLVNVTNSKIVLAIDKQRISILQPQVKENQFFIYVVDKGLNQIYDSELKLLVQNSDSILYVGNTTFGLLQKSGYQLYSTVTTSVSTLHYSFLSLINDNNLFVIRNDSVLSINSNEEILRLWDTKHSSHIISSTNYTSKDGLISGFVKSLESTDTSALMQWCKNVAQDLTLYHYFESKKLNDKIINKTGSELKSADTQKNAEALFSVYRKLHEALHERYTTPFVIEDSGLRRGLDGELKNSLKNKTVGTYQYYEEPVIRFTIKNTYYQYKMGFLFNEFDKLYVYPNESVRTK